LFEVSSVLRLVLRTQPRSREIPLRITHAAARLTSICRRFTLRAFGYELEF
jgi:hypothetical protein